MQKEKDIININSDNQIIKVFLSSESQKDNYKEGAELERQMLLCEKGVFNNCKQLELWLESFDLTLKDFEIFDSEEETNKLIFTRNEDKNGNETTLTENNPNGYLVDYNLIIEVYTLETETDYLKDFNRI